MGDITLEETKILCKGFWNSPQGKETIRKSRENKENKETEYSNDWDYKRFSLSFHLGVCFLLCYESLKFESEGTEMKIIYRIDTDDKFKIDRFCEIIKTSKDIVLPQGEMIKIYVISDKGEVTEIWATTSTLIWQLNRKV